MISTAPVGSLAAPRTLLKRGSASFSAFAETIASDHLPILTRSHADSDLRNWDMMLREKIGFKCAAVAVARKLAVIMHSMLRSGELFHRALAAV